MKAQEEYLITLCNFMKVSRSGYYNWLIRPINNRDKENKELTEIFMQNRNIYGTRRIVKILAQK
jgi:putative transposase